MLIVIIILIVLIGITITISLCNKKNKMSDGNTNNSNISNNEKVSGIGENQTESFNRSPQNVTIEIDENTISPENVSITITDNNKNPYAWGIEFKVQEKVNGEWQDLKYLSGNLSWPTIAYKLNKNKTLTQKLDIEKYYGRLSNGIYRIVKTVGSTNIYSNEFEIK